MRERIFLTFRSKNSKKLLNSEIFSSNLWKYKQDVKLKDLNFRIEVYRTKSIILENSSKSKLRKWSVSIKRSWRTKLKKLKEKSNFKFLGEKWIWRNYVSNLTKRICKYSKYVNKAPLKHNKFMTSWPQRKIKNSWF